MNTKMQSTIPVIPVKNMLVFPEQTVPIRVGRKKSIAAVQQAQSNGLVLIHLQTDESKGEEVSPNDITKIGTLARIERVRGSPEKGYELVIRGLERFQASEITEQNGCIQATGSRLDDRMDMDEVTAQVLLKSLKEMALEITHQLPGDLHQFEELIEETQDLIYLSHVCSAYLEAPIAQKLELLEMISTKDRVLKLLDLMKGFRDNLQVQNDIRQKLQERLGKSQREAILREQMKTISDELGQGDGRNGVDNIRKKIEDAQMPEEVKKVALDELRRLESIGSQSPESHVIRNYLDLLCALPWAAEAKEETDIENARKVLDSDHHGLEKIKKRILQFLSVMKLKGNKKGSILLFVGPPGVGKTSLGQSIAKALGRKFVRASMGGVRDESEIRGHRRTYIGAMPGRIIQALKRSGQKNPVFMLDEIDKMGFGYHGDPGAALLEVLDPEQNHTFMDHYLDVPFDLSKVFFVATANSVETIPAPLLDRMEVIQLTGYTLNEKLHIAKTHLVQKQLEEHGMTSDQVMFEDEVLMKVIQSYTREAGVRELNRQIAALCRWVAERVVAQDTEIPVKPALSDLEDALGLERYLPEMANVKAPSGVVTGMAWTPQGGDILFIESTMMPGAGRLTLTGQLGDVMKESAQIALSLVRSRLPAVARLIDFEKTDLHIHVPSGAIPKDGPSAGITMMTAIASLLSGKSVDPKLAMTGEITLRGAVTPVGGIKEKVIAAHRAGMKTIILPMKNRRDLKDVPEEVKSDIRFEFVETADQVLRIALGDELSFLLTEKTVGESASSSVPMV
ncbi:MAG: endopeptidase La [Oligoflexia bacterium]|nr:endopeptidase La [Oligoflexia bacterium]